jgi:hypothetical protein
MDLPLVDEIREMRRRAEESTDAHLHLTRVRAILNTLALLDRKLTGHPGVDIELPGDNLIEELCERWPALSDLTTIGPRPTQSFRERLRLRRQQMESAQQMLGPFARRQNELAEGLHELQHEQAHLLEDPKYAKAVAELGSIAAERDRVALELQPIHQYVNTHRSMLKLAESFLARIDDTIATTGNRPGVSSVRAATIAGSLVDALAQVRDSLQLKVEVPEGLEVPDEIDPEQDDALFAEVDRIRSGIAATIEAIEAEIAAHEDNRAALQQQLEAVMRQLVDRMG